MTTRRWFGPARRVRAWLGAPRRDRCSCRLPVTAGAVPANFWGVVPQATPQPEQFQRLKRAASTASASRSAGRTCSPAPAAASTGPPSTHRRRRAASAGHRGAALPQRRADLGGSVGARAGLRRPAKARRTCRSERPQRAGLGRFATRRSLRYGPNGSFWAETRRSRAADPHLADLERAELQVLRRQAQPGRVRQAGQALLRGDQSGRPRRQDDPRRPLRPTDEATFTRSPPQAYFATDFLDQMYRATPGIKSQFHGVALHPYTGNYQHLTPADRRSPRRAEGATATPARASGSPSWAGARSRQHAGNSFAKGPSGQVRQLKGAFACCVPIRRKWQIQRVYWFSVDD